MALHVTIFFIYAGLSEIQSLKTVEHVAVEAGRSVSIPCQYEDNYKNNVKYLCRGSSWQCSYVIKTNQANSIKYFISDDKKQRIVTFTINNVEMKDSDYYWCIVEKTGTDNGQRFQLSVTTKGQSNLYVDSQRITGYFRTQITIYCKISGGGQKQWCRVGGPCVKTSGRIDGTKVTIDTNVSGAYAVTMSDLRTENIGWYWCNNGDFQMPVFLHITERPTTTTRATTTIISTVTTTESTPVVDPHMLKHRSVPDYLIGAAIALGFLIVVVIVSWLIWFKLKRNIKTEVEPSSPQCGDDPVYCNITDQRPISHQNPCADQEMEITYSSVAFVGSQNSNKIKAKEEDVVYSTLAHS